MKIHVQKWGNSLGLRIPAHFSQEMELMPGSCVNIFIEDHRIVIMPDHESLDHLLSKVTSDNCHHELLDHEDFVGKEVW